MVVKRSWIPVFILSLAMGFGHGCAMRQSGYKISNETIAFIQPGTTTRAEVVENLGPPLLELQDVRVLAYSWGKMRVTGGSAAARQDAMQSRQMSGYSPPSTPIDEGGLVESHRWVCCVAWDENNRVTRIERIKLESATSLESAVRRWAAEGG